MWQAAKPPPFQGFLRVARKNGQNKKGNQAFPFLRIFTPYGAGANR